MNKEVSEEKPIFEDRKALLEIWKTRIEAINFYADLMWKSIQYFFLLISALISANLIGLGTILGLGDLRTQIYLLPASLIFSILVVVLSFIGETILRRRFSRMLELIVHAGKIEGLLGLNVDISKRLQELNVFPKDRHLFERFVKSRAKYGSEEKFIEGELGGGVEGRNMYTDMRKVYWLFILVGGFLILLNFFLIIYVHGRLVN